MTNKELKAIRQLLCLECSEAAEHIGGVSTRSWQRWEAGTVPVPRDVADEILMHLQLRNGLVAKRQHDYSCAKEKISLHFHINIDEFEKVTGKRSVVMWKITNAVAGECYSSGIASLI